MISAAMSPMSPAIPALAAPAPNARNLNARIASRETIITELGEGRGFVSSWSVPAILLFAWKNAESCECDDDVESCSFEEVSCFMTAPCPCPCPWNPRNAPRKREMEVESSLHFLQEVLVGTPLFLLTPLVFHFLIENFFSPRVLKEGVHADHFLLVIAVLIRQGEKVVEVVDFVKQVGERERETFITMLGEIRKRQ